MLSSRATTLSSGASCCAGIRIDDIVKVDAKMMTVRVKGLLMIELCNEAITRDLDPEMPIRDGREYVAGPTASVRAEWFLAAIARKIDARVAKTSSCVGIRTLHGRKTKGMSACRMPFLRDAPNDLHSP